MNDTLTWNQLIRSCRGWLYRRLPSWGATWHRKKLAGYERRWVLEEEGFTKEGFFRIFQQRVLTRCRPGSFYELMTGDGLVGSLGTWLERERGEWRVKAWEHRPAPIASLKRNRPTTEIHEERLTSWSANDREKDLVGITTRGSREATGVCREIRTRQIRPQWVGLWNPTMRSTWFHRMRSGGYQLELVYQRMEFYVDGERESGVGGQGSGVRGQGAVVGSQESGVGGGQKREK